MYELAATSSVASPLAVTKVKATNLRDVIVWISQSNSIKRSQDYNLHSVLLILCRWPEKDSSNRKEC